MLGRYDFGKDHPFRGDRFYSFLEDESKKVGDYVKSVVNLYTTGSFWHDSSYLEEDEEGEKYLVGRGRIIYRGLNLRAEERFLLKGKLGNFELRKKGDKLLITDYFTREPGPLGN
jgi:hypothetical protein